MPFTPKTVGGNIVSDANGVSFLTYQTADLRATVTTAGYFKELSANGAILQGSKTADKIFNGLDVVLIQCSDGIFQGEMTVSPTVVSVTEIVGEA